MNPFINKEYVDEVVAFAKKIEKIKNGKIDCYYMSALCLLLSPALRERSRKYISKDGIDLESMMKSGGLSSSEKELIRLASNLFNGRVKTDIGALTDCLDGEHYKIALGAMLFRKTGHALD